MAERNTRIRGKQIRADTVAPSDLASTNSESDGYIVAYDNATGKFTWIANIGGDLSGRVDDFTIKYENNKLKLADRIEENIMLLAFYRAVDQGEIKYSLVDGMIDEFEDESGVDTVNSINELYDSTDDLYEPIGGGLDSYVKLLLHCNGTDGSTTFTDSSSSGHTVTANGDAQIDTAQKKFGTGSGLFDGTGDYLTVPDSNDWDFGTGDFTIDFWVRFNSVGVSAVLIDRDNGNDFQIYWQTGVNTLFIFVAGSNINGSWLPSVDTWYHIAMVRASGTVTAYVDGSSVVSGSLSGNVSSANTLYIAISSLLGSPLNGWIDELRISKGIARWTSGFTPPNSEYSSTKENMTLISNLDTAESEPDTARIILFEEDVDAVTLNTDLKAYISIDNGSNYDQITLEDEGDWETGKRILSGTVDVSARTGTSIKWKVTTHNGKDLKLHAVGENW